MTTEPAKNGKRGGGGGGSADGVLAAATRKHVDVFRGRMFGLMLALKVLPATRVTEVYDALLDWIEYEDYISEGTTSSSSSPPPDGTKKGGPSRMDNLLQLRKLMALPLTDVNITTKDRDEDGNTSTAREVQGGGGGGVEDFSAGENLSQFLQEAQLMTAAVETSPLEDRSTVKLLTVHGSKGLEFHTVYLPGCRDGNFPIKAEDEEERRVFYVAVTRAARQLYLTGAPPPVFGTGVYGTGGTTNSGASTDAGGVLSPFVRDMLMSTEKRIPLQGLTAKDIESLTSGAAVDRGSRSSRTGSSPVQSSSSGGSVVGTPRSPNQQQSPRKMSSGTRSSSNSGNSGNSSSSMTPRPSQMRGRRR